MRVAPLGAYYADDAEKIPEQATLSAKTTHCHSEAVAGAIAVALAAAAAWRFRQSGRLSDSSEFLEWVAQRTPVSAVRRGIEKAARLPEGTSVGAAVSGLATGNSYLARIQYLSPYGVWRTTSTSSNKQCG